MAMGAKSERDKDVKGCAFCSKKRKQVKRLIANEKGVAICDECVTMCAELLLAEHRARTAKPAGDG